MDLVRVAQSALVCAAFVSFSSACDSDIPEPAQGYRITGKVSYSGKAADMIARKVLRVSAFTEFPPRGPARAGIVFSNPDFSSPIAYELRNVPMASYKVVAQIVDLDMPAATTGPSGGYHNMCELILTPMANVAIQNDRPVENVDITIYDANGDPCFRMLPRPDAGMPDAGATPDAAPPDAAPPDAGEADAPLADDAG